MDSPAQYRARLTYNNKYNRENYRSFSVRLNTRTEAEMIAFLEERPGLKSYLVSLIKSDMKKQKKRADKKRGKKKK